MAREYDDMGIAKWAIISGTSARMGNHGAKPYHRESERQDARRAVTGEYRKGYRSLHDRGLIRAEGRGRGWKLTEAGELVVKLLDYAGLCE